MSAQGGGISNILLTKLLSEDKQTRHVQVEVHWLALLFVFFCTHVGVCVFFLTRLEQQVQDKEVLERELYSRFVMVLNEKKAKIRGLQDAVRQLQQANDQQRDEEGRQRSAD